MHTRKDKKMSNEPTVIDLSANVYALSYFMEFDYVIEVLPDGRVLYRHDVYAPELYDGELMGDEWSLMNGYSGQDRYSGPLMHHSRSFIGGGMARDILGEPGLYVALVNYEADDSEPTEWAVARREA
jgi:hypothetical protein